MSLFTCTYFVRPISWVNYVCTGPPIPVFDVFFVFFFGLDGVFLYLKSFFFALANLAVWPHGQNRFGRPENSRVFRPCFECKNSSGEKNIRSSRPLCHWRLMLDTVVPSSFEGVHVVLRGRGVLGGL